jgi:(R)-2-hydroxyacyl-CoA dehydratese activating ATPase
VAPEPRVGVDIGSRTTKIVALREGVIVHAEVFDTTPDPLPAVLEKLAAWPGASVTATGYGRRLLEKAVGAAVMTEIKACARGAHRVRPACRLVIDIGGQDAKAVRVLPDGGFEDFELNDRCSAGTGRFLEVMARALGYDLDEFCREAMQADRPAAVSSMCTVFAESEVVAMLAGGEDRRRLALGLYESVIDRVYPLVSRLETAGEIVFCGGVARSRCLAGLLRSRLKRDIVVPPYPQILSALGAALA